MTPPDHSVHDRAIPTPASEKTNDAIPAHPEFVRAPRDMVASFTPPSANPRTIGLAHPFLWVVLGSSLFVIAWLLPASIYEHLFEEQNHVFLDLPTLLFTSGCIGATLVGLFVGFGGRIARRQIAPVNPSPLEGAPLTTYSLFIVMILMNSASFLLFVRVGGLGAFSLALAGHADFIHTLNEQAEISGLSGKFWVNLLAMSSVVFPLLWVTARNQRPYTPIQWLMWIFVGTYLMAAVCGGKRNSLARPLFSIMLIALVWPRGRLSLRGALAICGGALMFMMVVFVAASVLRDDVRQLGEATSIMARYLLSPFNNEAALVNDHFAYPGSGTGYFWFEWFWDFPIISDVIDMESIRYDLFGEMPPQGPRDRGQFLRSHGLSATTNLSAFGSSFVDFGWMGIFPFFIFGWIGGALWKSFLRGSIPGLILYPQFAYALAELRTNIIFPEALTNMGLVAIALIGISLWIERPLSRSAFKTSPKSLHRFQAMPDDQAPNDPQPNLTPSQDAD